MGDRSAQLVRLVNIELGRPLNRSEQEYAGARYGQHFLAKLANGDDTTDVVVAAVEDIRAARLVGGIQVGTSVDVPPPDDAMWGLFTDLNASHRRYRAGQIATARRESPNPVADEMQVPLGRRSPIELSVQPPGELSAVDYLDPLPAARVSIHYDDRVGLDTLLAAVRKRYPEMRRQGAVRGRPRLRQALELLKFICLEVEPGLNWRQRMEAWNAAGHEPSYKHASDFQMKFHRAEESFAGRKRGLEFFYDATARMTLTEIIEAADSGDRGARTRLKRITGEFESLPGGADWPAEPADLTFTANRALAEQAWADGLRGEFAPSARIDVLLRDLSQRIVEALPTSDSEAHGATKEDDDA